MMSTQAPVPRYPLGEYAYQGLWWGIIALPGLVTVLRVITTELDMTFFLFAVIGIPAIIVGQVIAGLLAWTFRRRQWRHWLGPVGAKLSLAYYGAWALLALTMPEANPGEVYPSLMMRMFGRNFADGFTSLLLWGVPVLYVALLAAIAVEGQRAVRRWGTGP